MLEPGSDEFATHPKVLRAGSLAAGLYARLVSYCRMHDTGGYVAPHVPAWLSAGDVEALEQLGLAVPGDLTARLLASLERVGLLSAERPRGDVPGGRAGDDRPSQSVPGWHIVGWSDGLSSSDKTRARKARYRERKRAAERPQTSAGDVPGASPVLSLSPPPSPPSHTLPSDSSSLSLSLGSTQTGAGPHAHARIEKPLETKADPSEPEPDVEEPEHGSPEARKQRYAKAYAKGISGVTGRPFALAPRERDELAALLLAFVPTNPATGKKLMRDDLDAWITTNAAAFAKASQGDEARFTGSLNISAFTRYLRAPAAPAASSAPARGRPEDVHRQRGFHQTDAEREAQFETQLRKHLARLPEHERRAEEARKRRLHAETLERERSRQLEQQGAT